MKKRVYYFDVLNVLACFSVIALHHNGGVWNFSNSWNWKTCLVVECFAYWAVPVFLMLSGANLLNYRNKYSTRIFFEKRFVRTVIPWLFWSISVLIWKASTGQIILESHSMVYPIELLLTNKIENVYWFFSVLFGIYLSIPILAPLVKYRNLLWYMVIMSFLCMGTLPIISVLIGINISFSVPVISGLIIFPILGYLLSTVDLKRKYRIILYLTGFGATLFRYVYTYIMSYRLGSTDTSIKGYEKFYSVLLAAAVFVFIKEIPWDRLLSESARKILSTMSSCSFGIYLIHMIVIYYELQILPFGRDAWLWRTVFIFVTYFISLGIVWGLSKIPILKRTVGN